jgi:NAD(P)-dependent dehydrogenase (short-subunit alcohol dehydrogenase family)
MSWDPRRIPSQTGKVFAITGGNGGLGFFTAFQLAEAGASVILCCRNRERADAAATAIRRRLPSADVSIVILDVSSLESVRTAGAELGALPRLDGLIENAGLVHFPRERSETEDGFELVLATNFLGHFALVEHVLPALERTSGSRIVTLGSLATEITGLHLDDLQLTKKYSGWQAYGQSKILMSIFGYELDRRLGIAGSGVRALVAHPGYAITGRSPIVPGVSEPSFGQRFADNLQGLWAQGKDRGAWPIVRAAADPEAFDFSSRDTDVAPAPVFYGPRFRVKGAPIHAKPADSTTGPYVGRAVWTEARALTGADYLDV